MTENSNYNIEDRQRCPYCNKELVGVARGVVIWGKPSVNPGDWVICYYCGEISKFDSDMCMIKLTPEELAHHSKTMPPAIHKIHKKILAMGRIK